MRTRDQIVSDQKMYGAGGGNSLVVELLMDIRDLLQKEESSRELLEAEQEEINGTKVNWKPFKLL